MTPRLPVWAAGLAGSVLAHGVLLAVLAVGIQPEPVTRQPMPDSELEVQAHVLERTEAREQPARGDPAAEASAAGSNVAQGAVQTSRARPVAQPPAVALSDAPANVTLLALDAPAALSLATTRPQPEAITSGAAPSQAALAVVATPSALAAAAPPLMAVQVGSATPLVIPEDAPVLARLDPVVSAQAAQVAAVSAPTTTVPDTRLAPEPLSARPAGARPAPAVAAPKITLAAFAAQPTQVAPAQPDETPASAATPQLAAWVAARPETSATPAARPNPSQIKAALAFSGDGADDVDPVSLAAFQSFMRPGDVATDTDPLRDGVAGVLAQVPCSRLQVSFDPETATLNINGHVPEDDLRGPVLAALSAQMGDDIAVSDNMLILPRPQCGALSGIASAGLPQSTDQITNSLLIGADTHARVFRFTEGKLLSLDMTAPDYDAYIYLDYFDAGGDVLHLEPNAFVPLRHARAQEAQRIGARTMQDQGLKLVVSPPFGQEIAVAFATSEPLYDGLRPMSEPAAPYLDWLRDRVAEKRRDNPAFKGEWVYFFVATSAQ